VQRALPIPQQPGVVVVTTAIDELTNDRNEMLLFLAPEIAGSMNGQSTRRRAAERTAGFLGNAVGFATGQDLGGVAQLGVGARFNKRQMLEADRVGLYLIARLGIDVQSSVDFWSAAYSASSTNAVRSFFGGRPTLEERLENLTEVAEEINTKLEQGQPLALR
jgi:predicted Zn-dependent protease